MTSNGDTCPFCSESNVAWYIRDPLGTWIECDICKTWYHAVCLKLSAEKCEKIERYHCPDCIISHGPSILKRDVRKSKRQLPKVNYADLDNGFTVHQFKWKRILESKKFSTANFQRLRGDLLTVDWLKRNGLSQPIIIEKPDGLGMKMLPSSITIRDIGTAVGFNHPIEVIDVATQQELPGWNMLQWSTYFQKKKKDQVLNVISLEISGTPLADQIVRPKVVRELDWIDQIWPVELEIYDFPKTQLYCLMSVKESYTDFHIDFGGTSVFYHIIKGSKHFYFIPPSQLNLKKYEKWITSPEQSTTFLGDLVKDCYEVHLKAGNTMIIPTGWIHAVYTPEDSIVIGGNFLHSLNIPGQLQIYDMEKRTNVPIKYRFPHFEKMCWYAAKKYNTILKDNPEILCKSEKDGLNELSKFLTSLTENLDSDSETTTGGKNSVKKNIPETITDPKKLAKRLGRRTSKTVVVVENQPTSAREEFQMKLAMNRKLQEEIKRGRANDFIESTPLAKAGVYKTTELSDKILNISNKSILEMAEPIFSLNPKIDSTVSTPSPSSPPKINRIVIKLKGKDEKSKIGESCSTQKNSKRKLDDESIKTVNEDDEIVSIIEDTFEPKSLLTPPSFNEPKVINLEPSTKKRRVDDEDEK